MLFSLAIEKLAKDPSMCLDHLIEFGPHPVWGGPLREDGLKNMLSLAGGLFIRNVAVDLVAVKSIKVYNSEGQLGTSSTSVIRDLPNYQFHYGTPIYYESRYNKD